MSLFSGTIAICGITQPLTNGPLNKLSCRKGSKKENPVSSSKSFLLYGFPFKNSKNYFEKLLNFKEEVADN